MALKHDHPGCDPKQELLMLLDWEGVLAKDIDMT